MQCDYSAVWHYTLVKVQIRLLFFGVLCTVLRVTWSVCPYFCSPRIFNLLKKRQQPHYNERIFLCVSRVRVIDVPV